MDFTGIPEWIFRSVPLLSGLDLPRLAAAVFDGATKFCTEHAAQLGESSDTKIFSLVISAILTRVTDIRPFAPDADPDYSDFPNDAELREFFCGVEALRVFRSDATLVTMAAVWARKNRSPETAGRAAQQLVRAWLTVHPQAPATDLTNGLDSMKVLMRWLMDCAHPANVAMLVVAIQAEGKAAVEFHACKETGVAGQQILDFYTWLYPCIVGRANLAEAAAPFAAMIASLDAPARKLVATLDESARDQFKNIQGELREELVLKVAERLASAGLPSWLGVPMMLALARAMLELAADIREAETSRSGSLH